ncbi:unnamed protein product [Mytilus edulis]|uniref:TTF-type domain-containing protein n=1 Tax=Mytilus edulis TaxID=6550 RepID=A0A8S3TM46_MYTED|nr:unnamed protein product [Mytilus edulis]
MATTRRSIRLTINLKISSVNQETHDKKEKENLKNPAEGKENIIFAGCCREEPIKIVYTAEKSSTEVLSHVLRLQTACELYLHSEFYADHPRIVEASTSPTISTSHLDTLFTYILSDEGDAMFCTTRDKVETIKLESKLTCTPGRWCSLLHAFALSSVIQKNTYMVYPDCNYGIRPLLNGTIRPRCSNIIEQFDTIYILWSRDGNLDNTPKAAYQPNHFVCLSICNNNTSTRETQKRRTRRSSKCVHTQKSTLDNNSSNSMATGESLETEKPLKTNEPLEEVNLHERPVDNATKYSLIKNRIPPEHFVYPSKEYKDTSKKSGKRKRSCQHQWFEQFKFITYSMENDGIYCLPCILVSIENTPGGRARLLITLPYKNWKDTVADMKNHSVSAYHKASSEQMDNFIEVMEKKRIGNRFYLRREVEEASS